MSRVLSSFFVITIILAALLSVLSFNKCQAQNTPSPADSQCTNGCEPWNAAMSCTIGSYMRLPFVLDISKENSQNIFNGNKQQVGYGFCPQVDQLQAFTLPDAAGWAAGDFKSGNATSAINTADLGDGSSSTPAFLRIFGAVGFQDTKTNIPKDSYSSSAMIFDPAQTCTTALGEPGVYIASFLVINFTMSNGQYRMVSSFDQSVQVGFQPSCDATDTCQVSPDQYCLGNSTGNKNCATCVAQTVADLNNTQIQVFASYYGTDATGRKMQSGSSNPLNFLALSSSGVFNKLKDDITSAADTVRKQVPGQN